jgi:aldose 1-epimerase
MAESTPRGPNAQIILKSGEWEAIVSPHGAALRGFYHRTEDNGIEPVVTLYHGAKPPISPTPGALYSALPNDVGKKMGGQGDVLIPFPGRVAGGIYHFNGQEYQLEKTDAEGPNAIHGFLRRLDWAIDHMTATRVTFVTRIEAHQYRGYPFALESRVAYQVRSSSIECSFEVKNVGDGAAPVAAGFHPYFTVGSAIIDEDRLSLPFAEVLEFKNLIPTGKLIQVAGTPLDFNRSHAIGTTPINNCYLKPARDRSEIARVKLKSTATGRSLSVWMGQSLGYVVLYSGDPLPQGIRRASLAIEPMTCGSDAFNHPDWGLSVLQPGEVLSGRWGCTAEQK